MTLRFCLLEDFGPCPNRAPCTNFVQLALKTQYNSQLNRYQDCYHGVSKGEREWFSKQTCFSLNGAFLDLPCVAIYRT